MPPADRRVRPQAGQWTHQIKTFFVIPSDFMVKYSEQRDLTKAAQTVPNIKKKRNVWWRLEQSPCVVLEQIMSATLYLLSPLGSPH